MKHVSLESQRPEVREFFGSLPSDPNGIAVESGGTVLWTVYPPDSERRRVLLERGRALMHRAQARNANADEAEVARVVEQAIAQVRGDEQRS